MSECIFCKPAGTELLWENAQLRIIDVQDALYPGFTRIIWKAHVAEMSDLSAADQLALMQAVFHIERLQRELLQADKINLASFGNIVPHLHWHIIPRWKDDAHFPQAVWAALPDADDAARANQVNRRTLITQRLAVYHAAIHETLRTPLPTFPT